MGAFRIRYHGGEIPLTDGDFVIGRSQSCQLLLDDPRVSRYHAVIRVREGFLHLDDLGSREGVLLNGAFVKSPTPIAPGDRIRIGDHEMILVWRSGPEKVTRTDLQPVSGSPADDSDLSTAPSRLLFDLAESALGARNIEESEWIVGKILAEIHYRISSEQPVQPGTIDFASRACVRVAELTGKMNWLDGLFEIHRIARSVLPGKLIDAIEPLVAGSRYREAGPLVAYVRTLREGAADMDAEETTLLGRLERLAASAQQR
ncbi:MAG: FHA domain-containing protein [Deltaproteobacteria bacterium]|nr:FHA domain-containing protein [Deltaproteobacteria bacterium]